MARKNAALQNNDEVRMYEAPPDKKDIYIDKLKRQGYNASIVNGTLTVKCESRQDMEQLKEKLGTLDFSVGFIFPE